MNESELFWLHKGDLHNITQVVVLLWLISIICNTICYVICFQIMSTHVHNEI